MLILVGVTVTVALNGGLFEKAREGAKGTEIAREKEELEIAVASAYDVATGIINKDELEKALGTGWIVEDDEGTYTVTSPNKNIYEISEDGTITYLGVAETVTALEDDNNELTIGAIEDLVDLAIAVNNGTTYEGQTITLLTSLDFNNEESYRTQNPETTVYTDNGTEIDINGDGTIEPIMKELTEGLGFMPIGWFDPESDPEEEGVGFYIFKGTFERNEKTISNLYINRPEGIASLFGGIGVNTTIQNLTIQKPKVCGRGSAGLAMCMNMTGQETDTLTIKNCNTKGGKIGAVNENCISEISTGLIYGYSMGQIKIMNCKNESVISGLGSIGVVYAAASNKITVDNCSNYGKIIVEDYNNDYDWYFKVGCAVVESGDLAEVSNCNNYGNIFGTEGEYISGVVLGKGNMIYNCTNYGKLNGVDSDTIAGVVCDKSMSELRGLEHGSIYNSNNFGEIICDTIMYTEIAGIGNSCDNVINCKNYGDITCKGDGPFSSKYSVNVAGIGWECLEVNKCINYGKISVEPSRCYVAGILLICSGSEKRQIINCANYGEIMANSRVSGLVDYDSEWFRSDEVNIYNSYNSGNLSGKNVINGIGYVGTIKNCYNLGNLTGIGHVDGRTHYCSYYFERNPNKLS